MLCKPIGPLIAAICEEAESPIIKGLGMGIAAVCMDYAAESSK